VTSIYLEPDVLERHVRKLEAKYLAAERTEARAEAWRTKDAEFILVGYGSWAGAEGGGGDGAGQGDPGGAVAADHAVSIPDGGAAGTGETGQGVRGGGTEHGADAGRCEAALEGRRPVEYYGRVGGNTPSAEEVLRFIEHTFAAEKVEELAHV